MIKNAEKIPVRSCRGGYTLLFAVLTATLVLGVAVFIVDVARKQHELSVAARNSIYSFYAADSLIECAVSAVNWQSPGFSSTTPSTLDCGSGTGALELVPDASISMPASLIAAPLKQQTGYVSLNFNTGSETLKSCGQLTITTGKDPSSGEPMTIMDARGYNLCVSTSPTAPDVSNPSTVERALRLIQSGIW